MLSLSPCTEIIGALAAICTTLAVFPQVLKIWKTHSVESISILTYIINSLGVLLWFTYGILIHSTPLIIANIFSLILSVTVLVLKIIWRNK